jgi:hypothetical protein
VGFFDKEPDVETNGGSSKCISVFGCGHSVLVYL